VKNQSERTIRKKAEIPGKKTENSGKRRKLPEKDGNSRRRAEIPGEGRKFPEKRREIFSSAVRLVARRRLSIY
jgi:hypothetical protein